MLTNAQVKAKENLVPHAECGQIFTANPNQTETATVEREEINQYLQHFVAVGEPCVKCGVKLERYIVTSEQDGVCGTSGCGWPVRHLHKSFGPVARLYLLLQFHPKVTTW